ncbi:MAG: ABC transporter substrate-binding protein [Rhizobiales bacterium]|nr:ABC transporter substrate-binding protein [Hyphomicrobiales bacterium]
MVSGYGFRPPRLAAARPDDDVVRPPTQAIAVIAAILSAATTAIAASPPQRIVSFNLCADQLAVALADPAQIAGLSPYAKIPSLSIVAEQAGPFPTLGWQAEGTVALSPDLVLVGPNDRSATQRMLRRFGLPVEEVALVTDLAAARKQILGMAQRLGHPERGAALVARLDAAVRRLQGVGPPSDRTALIVERGGYAAGPASLAAALLDAAGLRPPAGVPAGYGGYVSLERVLLLRPDLMVLKDPPERADDQGALFLTHPALRGLYPPERRIALPSRYTMCGGPALIAALDYLTGVMSRLATTR